MLKLNTIHSLKFIILVSFYFLILKFCEKRLKKLSKKEVSFLLNTDI